MSNYNDLVEMIDFTISLFEKDLSIFNEEFHKKLENNFFDEVLCERISCYRTFLLQLRLLRP